MHFSCPRCQGPLGAGETESRCGSCDAAYPHHFGFPDLRQGRAVDVDAPSDLARAGRLAERESFSSFAELRDRYYSLLPWITDDSRRREDAHFRAEERRAAQTLPLLPQGPLLDVGCGAGQYLLAAARLGREAAGVDASFCQLILARRLLADHGLSASLAAADAETLPFAAASFSVVLAADVIEHVRAPAALLDEAARVLAPSGSLHLSTPNRFSLTPEPHVGLLGVGWLPHPIAVGYVRLRTGLDYREIRLLSYAGLKRLLSTRFAEVEIRSPAPSPEELAAFGPLKRSLARLYGALSQIPLLDSALLRVAPYYDAAGSKPAA